MQRRRFFRRDERMRQAVSGPSIAALLAEPCVGQRIVCVTLWDEFSRSAPVPLPAPANSAPRTVNSFIRSSYLCASRMA